MINKNLKILALVLFILLVLQFLTSCEQLGMTKKVVVDDTEQPDPSVQIHTIPTDRQTDTSLDHIIDSLTQIENNTTVLEPTTTEPVTTYSTVSTSDLYRLYWLKVIDVKKQQDIDQLYRTVGRNYSIEKITELANQSNKYNETTYNNNKEFLDKLLNSYITGAAKRINIDKDGVVTPVKDVSLSTKTPKVK